MYIYIYSFSGAGGYRGESGAGGNRGGPGAGGGLADGKGYIALFKGNLREYKKIAIIGLRFFIIGNKQIDRQTDHLMEIFGIFRRGPSKAVGRGCAPPNPWCSSGRSSPNHFRFL